MSAKSILFIIDILFIRSIPFCGLIVGPWLWKQEKIKEEKGECELRGRHSDCYWVEVSKRSGKLTRSKESKSLNEEIGNDR
jgi:hypothetical protein